MKSIFSTITLSLIVTANCLAADSIDPKDMDLYGKGAAVKVFYYKYEPGSAGATFNILRVNPDVQAAGGSVAILEEIRNLRALADQDVYTGRGPDRLGRTVYGTVEPIPGSGFPQYEKRGLRSGDLVRLQSLLEAIKGNPTSDPVIKAIVDAFRSVRSQILTEFDHPAFRPQKAAGAMSSLDTLASKVGETKIGTLNERLAFGSGKEKLVIKYENGQPFVTDQAGVKLTSVSLDALERKLMGINIKFDVSEVMGKIKKSGGALGTVAVGAIVPILLSHAMVGDANAAQDSKSQSSTVRSAQPYIQTTTAGGVR